MSIASSPAHAHYSRSNHIHSHRPLVDPILCRIPVPYPTSVSSLASRHGYHKVSQVGICCDTGDVVISGFSRGHSSQFGTFLSWYTFTVTATWASEVDDENRVLIESVVTRNGHPGTRVSNGGHLDNYSSDR